VWGEEWAGGKGSVGRGVGERRRGGTGEEGEGYWGGVQEGGGNGGGNGGVGW